MTKYTYVDNGLAYDVVDVIKLYPEILNNTSWRDATYQFQVACNRFHPYVLGKLFLRFYIPLNQNTDFPLRPTYFLSRSEREQRSKVGKKWEHIKFY